MSPIHEWNLTGTTADRPGCRDGTDLSATAPGAAAPDSGAPQLFHRWNAQIALNTLLWNIAPWVVCFLERDCQSMFRRLIRKWERLLIMAKRIPALVEPRILEWAQEQLAIPKETAERLGKDADVLEFWEEGRRTRSWGQLRKLAEIYKRPLSHFYLLGPPKEKPLSQVSCPAAGEHRRPSNCVAFAIVRIGSHLAVSLTSGGGLLSGLKLKQQDQKPTLGSKVGLLLESSHTPRRPQTPACSRGC